MKKRALISVSDKTGIVEFAKELSALGYEIISTGGTEKSLKEAGIKTINISGITGFPECLDGRVKTLHPAVHAGLLAVRSDKSHMEQIEKLNINTIDIVCVNLYPFKSCVSKPDVKFGEAVENIDIGGPTMLRSAAKNYQDVLVIIDPADYVKVTDGLKNNSIDIDFRKTLMYKVFSHTAYYDSLIAGYLAGELNIDFPEIKTFAYEKMQDLRYGENPHQKAVFYREPFFYEGALTAASQLQGKELSYNNINDANGALDILREFSEPAVAAVKHSNPCGVAVSNDICSAYIKAHDADPISIYGGIIAANREIDGRTASEMIKIFLEIVIAPSYTEEALKIFSAKPNLRIMRLPTINAPFKPRTFDMKKVTGGILVQETDNRLFSDADLKTVTKLKPTAAQLEELKFCYKVVKHAKSNAIALSRDKVSVGIGVGQTNRIWAAEQAIEHAGDKCKGAVMASDAFFPFPDCVEAAHKAGITAIIQPGGSNNDAKSIEACDKLGIAMVFCGMRHFKH